MKMAVMRVHKTANYTIMSNHHFKEKEMSLKAKGLLSLMLSLPDDWDYSINGLATLSKDGRDSVMSALQELEKFGYLTRTRISDEKGRFAGFDYDIYEEPQKDKPTKEKPYTEKPNTENPQQLNTKELTTEQQNTELTKINDKEDKRAEAPNINFQLKIEEPNALTNELVKVEYIEKDDLFVADYNQFINELVYEHGFEIVRSCVYYFAQQMKSRNFKDEFGNEILSKLAYFKTSIESGIRRLSVDSNVPDWLNYINN